MPHFSAFLVADDTGQNASEVELGLFSPNATEPALTMLARIRAAGMLTEDEFSSLSPETRGAVELLLGAR